MIAINRIRPALLVLVAAWLAACALWIQPGVSRPDGAGYFVYLPSTWLDHDLVFYNEWQRFGMIDHGIIRDVTSAPQGFEPLTKDQFRTILRLAQADPRGFVH